MLENFNDIENLQLRANNRGAVLANITEDYLGSGVISGERLDDFISDYDGYLKQFPIDERAAAKVAYKTELRKRGL